MKLTFYKKFSIVCISDFNLNVEIERHMMTSERLVTLDSTRFSSNYVFNSTFNIKADQSLFTGVIHNSHQWQGGRKKQNQMKTKTAKISMNKT